MLRTFFQCVLGVDAETAARDICRVELLIGAESMEQMKRQIDL